MMGLSERLRKTALILETQAELAIRIAKTYAPEREKWEQSKGDTRFTAMIQYQLDQEQLARSLRKDAKEATDAAAAIDRLIGFAVHDDGCGAYREPGGYTCGLSGLLKEIGDE